MSPEAQRIAIAEACGYRRSDVRRIGACYYWLWDKTGSTLQPHLPDYLSDLNAMHDAEKTLGADQQLRFTRELLAAVWKPEMKQIDPPQGGWWSITTFEAPKIISATAGQRAEAFLRTLGKWDDTK